MILQDTHVHTANSPDGSDRIEKLVREAKAKGLTYLATTDHLDYDLKYGNNRTPVYWKHIDVDAYYKEWVSASQNADGLDFCFGIEAGFDNDVFVNEKYIETFNKYPFDVVINSVHCVNGMDVYFPIAFMFKSKSRMYGDYLDKVLQSLDAPYHYDIVAHLGYVTRNAPYRNKTLNYADYPEKFDAILNGVISRGKCLEVNTHHAMNPTREILERYYALGGRKVSFGSDSHRNELCKDYAQVCALLKGIGFTHFCVFKNHVEIIIPIG